MESIEHSYEIRINFELTAPKNCTNEIKEKKRNVFSVKFLSSNSFRNINSSTSSTSSPTLTTVLLCSSFRLESTKAIARPPDPFADR